MLGASAVGESLLRSVKNISGTKSSDAFALRPDAGGSNILPGAGEATRERGGGAAGAFDIGLQASGGQPGTRCQPLHHPPTASFGGRTPSPYREGVDSTP